MGNNIGKPVLIPHDISDSHVSEIKDLSLEDGPASYQLVGEVTAHQGNDG